MKNNYIMVSALEMKVEGDFPKFVHPAIGDEMGVFNVITLSKPILVTEFNQVEFTAPYELGEGEMEILNLTSTTGEVLAVNDAQIWINKDGVANVVAGIKIEVEADNENQAFDLVNEYLAKLEISGFDYMDHVQERVYSCEVKSMDYEVGELVY